MSKADNSTQIVETLRMLKTILSEQGIAPNSGVAPIDAPAPKRKPTKVRFGKGTDNPFEVIFSERGFLIEGTRLSFEELETAISKNYAIVLNGGQGMTLDAVKMQQILKYKELY